MHEPAPCARYQTLTRRHRSARPTSVSSGTSREASYPHSCNSATMRRAMMWLNLYSRKRPSGPRLPAVSILHSDQGWHYQHKAYQNKLKDNGLIQSMSRMGNCLDNAMMENFFGIMKSELLYLRRWNTIEEFETALDDYIEYYNNDRIKLRLDGMSPAQYRAQQISNL